MANIAVSDKTHDEISIFAHDQYATMKDIADRMWAFVCERKEEFIEEMF